MMRKDNRKPKDKKGPSDDPSVVFSQPGLKLLDAEKMDAGQYLVAWEAAINQFGMSACSMVKDNPEHRNAVMGDVQHEFINAYIRLKKRHGPLQPTEVLGGLSFLTMTWAEDVFAEHMAMMATGEWRPEDSAKTKMWALSALDESLTIGMLRGILRVLMKMKGLDHLTPAVIDEGIKIASQLSNLITLMSMNEGTGFMHKEGE